MRIERIQANEERGITTALIVNSTVLARVAATWKKDDELFTSQWANIVARWCVKYFIQYGKPPRGAIQGLFESWAAKGQDLDTVKLVERFLVSLDGDYRALSKEINPDYVIDQAAAHFNRVKLAKLSEAITGDLDSGDIEIAKERVGSFGAVNLGTGTAIDVLHDTAAIEAAFADREECIIEYPGALGQFFKDAMQRDGLIAFMGPEKRGKTFWLMDAAWRAMLQRRRVAVFAVGDMSQNQMMRRFMTRAARTPVKAGEVRYPERMRFRDGEVKVKHEIRTFERPLNWKIAQKAVEEAVERTRTNESLLKLVCHPNSTATVAGIRTQLRDWARSGWVCDVVVIDYADILAPEPGSGIDVRHQINATWKALRAMTQEFHCLGITATQADADSYSKAVMSMANFSEDKRKNAHVTGIVGINQTQDEKTQGAFRLNWLVAREMEFSPQTVVGVASCLSLANPAVKSCWPESKT